MRTAFWPFIAVVLLAVAGTTCWRLAAVRSRPKSAERVHIEISGEKFDFDRRYLSAERDDGGELAAFFPNFTPAAVGDDIGAHTDLEERFARIVFVELKPVDAKLDPSERTARLYMRFLSETSRNHPGGLVARDFETGSPFEGDELVFVPPDGQAFSARCHRSDAGHKLPDTCIAVFRSGAVDAQIRFSADRLSDWEALLKGVRGLIETARS